MCPVCNEAADTIMHILVQCKIAKACWQVFNAGTNIEGALKFIDWLAGILEGQSKNSKAKILTLCWSIWRSRNDLVWHNKRWTILRIVAKVWEYLSQWNAAQNRGYSVPLIPTVEGDEATTWVKPQHDTVKITVDASIFQNLGMAGAGIVARNHDGHLILAKSICSPDVMNPTLAEAMAVKEALSWAMEMGWSSITVESDCMVVIQLIWSSTPMRSRLGMVAEE
ncbi:uncharacterized protein LOC141691450 [Apium graveolens]|uniref:uncharacterized protein LOC141691450 n=1 Tax=Apium graveolens TaxID=4045 RepID=UPI003D7B9F94